MYLIQKIPRKHLRNLLHKEAQVFKIRKEERWGKKLKFLEDSQVLKGKSTKKL